MRTDLAHIKELTRKIKAERDAAKQPVDQDLLKRQREARVNFAMRTSFRQRNSV